MKKLLLSTASFILLAFVFSACKKNKEETAQTVAQKLQYNWTIDNYIYNYHDADGDERDTIPGVPGDFMNFKADGTLTTHFEGEEGNGIYLVISNTQVSINGQTFTIKSLTSTQLVIYSKGIDPDFPGEYEEETLNLSRK